MKINIYPPPPIDTPARRPGTAAVTPSPAITAWEAGRARRAVAPVLALA